MDVVKYVLSTVVDVLNMNLTIFNYRFSLMEILLFTVLGGLALALIFNIAE